MTHNNLINFVKLTKRTNHKTTEERAKGRKLNKHQRGLSGKREWSCEWN